MKQTGATQNGLTYADAGVNIDAGNALVDRIKQASAATRRPEVLGNLGGFGALCKLPTHYKNPVLVSGTDGVGTKLKLAIDSGRHATVGIDLVAMCVNDLLVTGAEPLFFLDYYATSALDVDVAESVITGIAEGCKQAGAALIGGETAEMPGMYQSGDYDLAGFCVGVVEQDQIIDGSAISEGNALIGISSSGAHSNGYSLIRKILDVSKTDIHTPFEERQLIDYLLAPTRIYVKPLLELMQVIPVHGMAHITGGGITENLPRVLPQGIAAEVDLSTITASPLFNWLQQSGAVSEQEMLRTFNCGIGMVVVVAADNANTAIDCLTAQGETACVIGKTVSAGHGESVVGYRGSLFS